MGCTASQATQSQQQQLPKPVSAQPQSVNEESPEIPEKIKSPVKGDFKLASHDSQDSLFPKGKTDAESEITPGEEFKEGGSDDQNGDRSSMKRAISRAQCRHLSQKSKVRENSFQTPVSQSNKFQIRQSHVVTVGLESEEQTKLVISMGFRPTIDELRKMSQNILDELHLSQIECMEKSLERLTFVFKYGQRQSNLPNINSSFADMRTPPRGTYEGGEPQKIISLPDLRGIRSLTFGLEYGVALETFTLVSMRFLNIDEELVKIISNPDGKEQHRKVFHLEENEKFVSASVQTYKSQPHKLEFIVYRQD